MVMVLAHADLAQHLSPSLIPCIVSLVIITVLDASDSLTTALPANSDSRSLLVESACAHKVLTHLPMAHNALAARQTAEIVMPVGALTVLPGT